MDFGNSLDLVAGLDAGRQRIMAARQGDGTSRDELLACPEIRELLDLDPGLHARFDHNYPAGPR